MHESKLAEVKAKGEAVKNSQTKKVELLKRKLDRKNQDKTFGGEERAAGTPQSDD